MRNLTNRKVGGYQLGCGMELRVVFAFGKGTTFVLSHIYFLDLYIICFATPKDPSIFGLHRQRRFQNFSLGHDCVASIGIYVP